jgi:hypothetical protein
VSFTPTDAGNGITRRIGLENFRLGSSLPWYSDKRLLRHALCAVPAGVS